MFSRDSGRELDRIEEEPEEVIGIFDPLPTMTELMRMKIFSQKVLPSSLFTEGG